MKYHVMQCWGDNTKTYSETEKSFPNMTEKSFWLL